MVSVSRVAPGECFTCTVAHDPPQPELVAFRSARVMVNHYHALDGEGDRTGWFIVAPVRHVSRWFEMTSAERGELAEVAAGVDAALTSAVGARRCMVASLGWFTLDHVHVHVVPTVTFPVTYGWELFGPDRFVPVGGDPAAITARVAAELTTRK